MSIASDIHRGRKLGNALASAFPGAAGAAQRAGARVRRWVSSRRVTGRARALVERLRGRPRVAALQRLWIALYWPNFSADRVDWSQLPDTALSTSRATYRTALALALLAPLAMLLQWPAVVVDAKPAAAWSLLLWPPALGLAWGALVAGAALANRPAFIAAVLLDLAFIFGTSAMELGRDHAAALAPLVLLAAAWWRERMRCVPGRRDAALGVVSSVIACGCVGGVAAVLSPATIGMGRWKLLLGAALGAIAGVALHAGARRSAALPLDARGPRMGIMVAVLGAGAALHAYGLSARGGFAVGARSLRPMLDLYAGYLWPLWYFVGAGVIFKVISATRTLADTARDVVPGRVFTPMVCAALPVAAAFLWAPAALGFPVVGEVASLLVAAGRGWFWDDFPRATAALMVRWLLLAQVASLPVLALLRRLHGGEAASLLYLSIFGWLLVYEYVHQTFAFTRSTPHSAMVILFAAVAQVTLLQSATLRIGRGSTPAWPSAARLAILGGAALLAVLQIHARAALGDARVLDEICLYMFQGVLDAGLPVALYVWAGRARVSVPVSALFAVGTFALGAALSLPLTLGDKLAHVGGSWGDLLALADARAATLLAGDAGAFDLDLDLPWAWVAARGMLALGALAALGSALAASAARRGGDPALVRVYAIAAAGCGLASFVRARPSLPFTSPRWMILLAPARQSLEIDAHFVAQYMAYAIPALLMALAWRRLRGAGAIAMAFAMHMAVAVAWPEQEAWLRSTEVLSVAGAAGLFAGAVGLWLARRRAESVSALVGWWRWAGASVALALMALLAWERAAAERMIPAQVPSLSRAVEVPAGWTRAAGGGGLFRRGGGRRPISLLSVSVEPLPAGGARALLGAQLASVARQVEAFTPMRPRSGITIRGGVSASYTFQVAVAGGSRLPLAGTLAVLPRDGATALVLALAAPIDDWQVRRWDLVRIADTAPSRAASFR